MSLNIYTPSEGKLLIVNILLPELKYADWVQISLPFRSIICIVAADGCGL